MTHHTSAARSCWRSLALSAALLAAPMLIASAQGAADAAANPAVDAIFARWDRNDSPGCTVGIARDGRMVYQRGYGMANLDYGIPNTPETVFYAGSVSKQLAAASVALLAMEGRIALDDEVRRHIPELPDYGAPVTIRQLVHHTSGLRDIYQLMRLAGLRTADVFPDEDQLALIARQRELNFAPGSEYLYSNSGYFLLSEIVERVTGTSLREYAYARIFRPLGMVDTHFHDDPGHVMPRRAMSYQPDGRGGYRISYLQNFDKVGAGGLYTTIADLVRWAENSHTRQVGGDTLQQLMHTRGVLTGGDTLPYAFGQIVGTHRGLRTVSHGGTYMGYRAHLLRFPDERLTVVELCNLGNINPEPLAYAVAEVFLGDRMAPPPPTRAAAAGSSASAAPARPAPLSPAALAAFAGDYYSEELDVTYRVTAADGALHVRIGRMSAERAVHVEGDTFRVGTVTLRFERAARDVTAIVASTGRVRNVRLVRR